MLAGALLLVGAAGLALVAGAVTQVLALVHAAIAAALVAALLLGVGVARNRPRRGGAPLPVASWSAAADGDAAEAEAGGTPATSAGPAADEVDSHTEASGRGGAGTAPQDAQERPAGAHGPGPADDTREDPRG